VTIPFYPRDSLGRIRHPPLAHVAAAFFRSNSCLSFPNRTLFQETVSRVQGFDGARAPIVVSNDEHRFLVAEQMSEIGVKPRDSDPRTCRT